MRGMACRSAQHRVCSMRRTLVRHAAGDPAGGWFDRRVVHRRVVHRPVLAAGQPIARAAVRRLAGRSAHAGGRRALDLVRSARAAGELRAREVRAGHSSPRRESAGRGSVPPPSGLSTAQARPGPPLPQAARDLLADASRGLGRAIRATESRRPLRGSPPRGTACGRRGAGGQGAARPRSAGECLGVDHQGGARSSPSGRRFSRPGRPSGRRRRPGLHRLVTAREADDMVRQVSAFLDLVEESLLAGVSGRVRVCAPGSSSDWSARAAVDRAAVGRAGVGTVGVGHERSASDLGPARAEQPSSSASKLCAISRAPAVGHWWMGTAAPWACCTADRSGSTGDNTNGPNRSRSSASRYSCSVTLGRKRLITTPSGCSAGRWATRSVWTASSARCTPVTANSDGSVTSTARSAAVSALLVS